MRKRVTHFSRIRCKPCDRLTPLTRVDAKIVFQDGCVWLLKRCPEHGAERVLVADDIGYYKLARETIIKTPQQVIAPNRGLPAELGDPASLLAELEGFIASGGAGYLIATARRS